MAKIELKKPIVEEIASTVEGAQAVVLVNYSGLNVEQDTELRKTLREAGVTYKVYKNTMMKLAFKGTEFEALADDLNGTNAIAVSKDDATAPARILAEFAKKNDKLELISGVVEGKYADKAAIAALASIPSREVLLSRLLGSMQGTIASFARVIKAIADQNGDAAAAE
jgi:large subunit ribosomal protein L10